MARSSPLSQLASRSATAMVAFAAGVGMALAGPGAPRAQAATIPGLPDVVVSGSFATGLKASSVPVVNAGPSYTIPGPFGISDTISTFHNTFTTMDATLVPSSNLVPLANLADSLAQIAETGLSIDTLGQLASAITQIGQLASGLNQPLQLTGNATLFNNVTQGPSNTFTGPFGFGSTASLFKNTFTGVSATMVGGVNLGKPGELAASLGQIAQGGVTLENLTKLISAIGQLTDTGSGTGMSATLNAAATVLHDTFAGPQLGFTGPGGLSAALSSFDNTFNGPNAQLAASMPIGPNGTALENLTNLANALGGLADIANALSKITSPGELVNLGPIFGDLVKLGSALGGPLNVDLAANLFNDTINGPKLGFTGPAGISAAATTFGNTLTGPSLHITGSVGFDTLGDALSSSGNVLSNLGQVLINNFTTTVTSFNNTTAGPAFGLTGPAGTSAALATGANSFTGPVAHPHPAKAPRSAPSATRSPGQKQTSSGPAGSGFRSKPGATRCTGRG